MVVVEVSWYAIPVRFPTVEIDQFVVMPQPVHDIIFDGSPHCIDLRPPTKASFGSPVSGSLPTVIRSFKAAATQAINEIQGRFGSADIMIT